VPKKQTRSIFSRVENRRLPGSAAMISDLDKNALKECLWHYVLVFSLILTATAPIIKQNAPITVAKIVPL
jgi:hypothetical protein